MVLKDYLKNYRLLIFSGVIICLVGELVNRFTGSSNGPGINVYYVIGVIFPILGLIFILTALVQWNTQTHTMDERYVLHRLKATRASAIVGFILLGGWFMWEQVVNHVFRMEILVIIGAMAAAKIGTMIYYMKVD